MLNYRRFGQGAPCILQHGFLGGGGYFAPQMASMGSTLDVIAPDLPGFAGSHDQPHATSIKQMSDAQIAFANALGLSEFYLLGHSMGGMISLQTALDHPQRVRKLVLYGTHCSGDLPDRFETFADTAKNLDEIGLDAMRQNVTASWFDDGTEHPMYQFCLDAGSGASKEAVKACLNFLPEWDVTHRLNELKIPVLIICGDRDRSIGLNGLTAMDAMMPNSELCVLPQAAHCAHLEQSAGFDVTVQRFLLETSADQG